MSEDWQGVLLVSALKKKSDMSGWEALSTNLINSANFKKNFHFAHQWEQNKLVTDATKAPQQ